MPNELTEIVVDEISLCDRGANPGAKAILVKRDFSQDQRDAMASKGTAMPDGSYPIANTADLKNAIQAFGRAKNKAATKAHIKRRAKALGATDMLPEEWRVSKRIRKDGGEGAKEILEELDEMLGVTGYGEENEEGEDADPADADMSGTDFNSQYARIEAREYAADVMEEAQEAMEALYRSVHSILDDEEIADPEAALKATFDQFREHMAGIVPEAMEKAISDSIAKALNAGSASEPPTDVKGNPMSEDVKKALEAATAEIASLKDQIAKSFSADEAEFMAKMDGEAKDKFKGMTPDERKKLMEKECGKMTKRDDLPEDIRKALNEAEDLKKRLGALEAEREFETFKKRASDCGLASDAAKHLQVIAKASPEALDFVEKLAKAVHEVEKRSPLFKEVGSDNGADASTANAQLVAKAHEIVASEKVSFAKAFTEACTRHPDLYKAYNAEARS